ncbi:VanZ family protein [Ramlibacter sp. AN1133]|uniref:VanZ family protein n=1 Tax=Ramlibacter sp. AN1133 TaxID=3133429 RepID=UPI0030BFF9F2
MLLPYSVLEALLREFTWLKRLMNFLDTVAPAFELDHMLAFGVLAFLTHLAWRGVRAWHVALAVLALGALMELVQILIPGREAAVLHVLMDVAGGVAGFGIAWLFTRAWGSDSLPDDYKLSTHWVGENSES